MKRFLSDMWMAVAGILAFCLMAVPAYSYKIGVTGLTSETTNVNLYDVIKMEDAENELLTLKIFGIIMIVVASILIALAVVDVILKMANVKFEITGTMATVAIAIGLVVAIGLLISNISVISALSKNAVSLGGFSAGVQDPKIGACTILMLIAFIGTVLLNIFCGSTKGKAKRRR